MWIYVKGSSDVWNVSSWHKANWCVGRDPAGGNKLTVEPCLLLWHITCCGRAGPHLWHGSCGEAASAWLRMLVLVVTGTSGVILKTLLWNWDGMLCCLSRPFLLPFCSPWQLWPVPHIWNEKSSVVFLAVKPCRIPDHVLHYGSLSYHSLPLFSVPSLPVTAPVSIAVGVIPLALLHPPLHKMLMVENKEFTYSVQDLTSSSLNCPHNIFLIKSIFTFSL